jgi:hypothetical protein
MCVFAAPVAGQGDSRVMTTTIPDSLVCDCISLDTVVVLADIRRRIQLRRQPIPTLAVDSRGRVILGRGSSLYPLVVFNSDGSVLRTYGRYGAGTARFGPGPIIVRIGAGDTVHVFHQSQHHVFAPGLRHLVRSGETDFAPIDALILGDTTLVQHTIRQPRGKTAPLHLLDAGNRVIRSFGAASDRPLSGVSYFDRVRSFAATTDGQGFWVGYWNRYEIEKFARDGGHILRVIRTANWFPPYDEHQPDEPFTRPSRPRALHLRESADKLLWVLLTVADPAWKPNLGGVRLGGDINPKLDLGQLFDTVLEALDPSAARVVARVRLGSYILPVDGGAYAQSQETSDGSVKFYVWRARIRSR